MKLVREHINEKFSKEESDPIQDLGIGMYQIYKNLKKGDLLRIVKRLDISSNPPRYYAKDGIIEIDRVTHNNNDDIISIQCTYYENKIDLRKNKELRNEIVWRWSYNFFKEYFEPFNRKQIYEKFEEDSDPIRDMGIGYSPYRQALRSHQIENILNALGIDLLAEIQRLFQTNNLSMIYYLGTHSYEVRGEISPSARWIESEISDGNLIKQVDTKWNAEDCTLRLFETSIGKICNISFHGIKSKYRCDRFIGDIQTAVKIYNPIKNESFNVNEKFEEETDPIRDLGIGIINKLKKDSLKVRKHESVQGHKIAAYMSHISMVSEENLYLIDHKIANILLERSYMQEFVGDMESGFGIEFAVWHVWLDEDYDGVIVKEKNAFSVNYWGNLQSALKAYELENLTDN